MANPVTSFLTDKGVGGVPNWAWAVAIAVGVGAAYFIPKLSTGQTQNQQATAAQAANQLPSTIDPLTGVPYDIESQINPATGLPAYYGGPGVQPTSNQPSQSSGITTDQYNQLMAELAAVRKDASIAANYANEQPPKTTSTTPGKIPPIGPQRPIATQLPARPAQYAVVGRWQAVNTPWNSTLGGIASHYGVSTSRLQQLNPQITNPNVVTPGERVRIS